MTRRWLVDLETFSEAELSEIGMYAYAMHPTTDIMTASWVELDERDQPIGDPVGWMPGDPPPACFAPAVDGFFAYNAPFDGLINEHILAPRYGWPAIPPERWQCLMVRSYYGNFPGKLEKLAEVLAAGERKDMEGHRLMMRLARPAKPTVRSDDPRRHHDAPAVQRLMEYNKQDVRAEAALVARLPRLPPAVDRMVEIDRVVNRRGVQVDLALVDDLQWCADVWKDELRTQLRALTKGDVDDENDKAGAKRWLRAQGLPVREGKGAFDKAAKDLWLADPAVPEGARALLLLSRELGKTSLAKLAALKRATCPDGRLRGMIQVYGAHQTGRTGGRIVQPQNFPKGIISGKNPEETAIQYEGVLWAVRNRDIDLLRTLFDQGEGQPSYVLEALASLMRCCFIPRPGYKFYVADYNAIEPRMVAWLSGCAKMLTAYNDPTRDLYIETAAGTLKVPLDGVTKKQRNDFGKPTVIGGGYGLGPTRLQSYAWDQFKAKLTPEECQKCISGYRGLYPEIPAYWRALEGAAKRAVGKPGTTHECRGIYFKMVGSVLKCLLPSGRCLHYNGAGFGMGKYGPVIEFDYEDNQTHQWTRGSIWGGTFTENIDQALCADLLFHALREMENEGMPAVLHIYDEVVAEVPEDDDRGPRALESIICRLPSYLRGLPVKAEGWAGSFYRK